jgi:hypothetical protein
MRAAIIVSLLVLGTLLVLAPLVAEYLLRAKHQDNVVRLLEKPETKQVSLQREELSTGLCIGSWVVGAGLAGTGVVLAVREMRLTAPRPADLA